VSFKIIMTTWQDRISQHNTRPARPRPRPRSRSRPQCARPRPIFGVRPVLS